MYSYEANEEVKSDIAFAIGALALSIFVAQLGFAHNEELLLMAKTGILAASLLAGVAGFIWLYLVSKPPDSEG
jgi:NhaA family Na+:H+ antiporter